MNDRHRRGAAAAVAALGLFGCQVPAVSAEVAAVIVDPDAKSRAELERAVSALLQVPSVTLAGDALTASSELLIERSLARDARGLRITGRDYDRPESFHLFKSGAACVLVQGRDGKRAVLAETRCERLK
ncbi:MAG TPA: hypothetical protein VF319_17985 [Caldimonas sp.]